MKKLLILILVAALISAFVFTAADDDFVPASLSEETTEEPVKAENEARLRVGLFYGSGALPTANLANEVGSGYRFGWFDAATKEFTAVGFTAEEKITVLKDKNLYLASGVYYDGLPPSGASTIGAFHAQSGEVYESYEDACIAADGITANGTPAFAAYINGQYRVRAGNYTKTEDAQAAVTALGFTDGTVVGGSETCYAVTVTQSGRILFEFDNGTGSYLGIEPMCDTKAETWFKGYRYNGGFEYKRINGNDITVINVVSYGNYTRGVIPYEVGPLWHDEALKVAALCASSFAASNAGKHRSNGFDVCGTIDCQVYSGLNRATDKTNAACDAVAGLAVYYDGKVCNTVYHSSNGGSTESSLNVWGQDYPYLQAVRDDMEPLDSISHGRWVTSYSGEDISMILTAKGYPIGTVTKAYVEEYTAAGNVYRMSFEDAKGVKHTFTMERCRMILGSESLKKYTYSQRFAIFSGSGVDLVSGENKQTVNSTSGVYVVGADGIKTISNPNEVYVITANGIETLIGGTGNGMFTFSGTGWGHNVGLSQYGSLARAEAGWTYEQIIKFYYTGVEILPVSY